MHQSVLWRRRYFPRNRVRSHDLEPAIGCGAFSDRQPRHARDFAAQASGSFDTSAVAPGYFAYTHSDLERQIRDLPNFVPAEKYASGTPEMGEIGKCERFRYILSPDLPSFQDAGAAVASWTGTGSAYSTTGTSMDVYPVIVLGADAFSQIAVRGLKAMDPTFLPPGEEQVRPAGPAWVCRHILVEGSNGRE